MFFVLFSFLSYFKGYLVYPNVGIVALPGRFGFQADSNYTINVTKSTSDSILILIATNAQANNYLNSITEEHPCDPTIKDAGYINIIPTPNGNGSLSGTIKEKDMYYTIIGSCNPIHDGYSFHIQYINPNSYLSYDEQPILITLPVIAGVTGLLFIIWLINWFINFSLKNSLHLYLTIAILLTVTYDLLYIFEYINLNKSDYESPVYVARKIFRVFQETALLSAILMASEGWCIIHNEITWWKMLLSFFVSAGVAILYALTDFVNFATIWLLLVALLFSSFVAGYLFLLIKGVQVAREHVIAHLFVIAESGIDYHTTPIYSKFKIFKSVTIAMIAYFFVLFIRSLFLYFFIIPKWIRQLIYDSIILVLISVIAFAFRMKKGTKRGYMMVGDDDTDEPRIFDREDIQAMNLESIEGSASRPYEDGMTLPAQPFIRRNKKKKNESEQNESNEQRNQELLGNDIQEE